MSQLSYTNLVDSDIPTASGFNSRFLLAINLLNSGVESDNIAALAVTSAKLAGGAVTGAKIAMGSDAQGDILYRGASNYERLAAGTLGQFLKTNGASSNPSWASAGVTDYRKEMFVVQATTATITVGPGLLDVSGIITKTANTTLTLSTAADWAGGSSLRAVSTYGYVGVDTSGNIKLHTTAPTHSDYAVSITAGKKRYATWSGTVYRIIGWFFMNATGSGELNAWEVNNLREAGASNSSAVVGTSDITATTIVDMTDMIIRFYSSGGPVRASFSAEIASSGGTGMDATVLIDLDGATLRTQLVRSLGSASTGQAIAKFVPIFDQSTPAQGTHTYKVRWSTSTGTVKQDGTTDSSDRELIVTEL